MGPTATHAEIIEAIKESHISPAMDVDHKPPNKIAYGKGRLNFRGIFVMNHHFARTKDRHIQQNAKPVTVDDIYMPANWKYHDKLRKMLRQHDTMIMTVFRDI